MLYFVYSVKGGQGKTTISIGYAKHKKALYLTNDYESGTVDIYKDMFAENQLQVIKPETKLEFTKLRKLSDVVFDFGGWVDERVINIAKNVDCIIIPIFYQSMADLMPCIKIINSLLKYNKNIVVLINNTDTNDVKGLKSQLEKHFPDNKVLVVNRSKYINRLANEGKTISDLSSEGGIAGFQIKRSGLEAQLNELYNYLDNI